MILPFGGLDQQLTRVLTYIESEKIKAVVDVRDPGLLLREFQTTFLRKATTAGFTFISSTSSKHP